MSHFEFLQTFEAETDNLLQHYMTDEMDFDFRSDRAWTNTVSSDVPDWLDAPQWNRLGDLEKIPDAQTPDFKKIENELANLGHLEMPKEFESVFEKVLKDLEAAVERAHELTAGMDERTMQLVSHYSF